MKKILFFNLAVLIVFGCCNRPNKTEQIQRVKTQADSMCMALKDVNTGVIFKYSHPIFIAKKNGKAEMGSAYNNAKEARESHGIFVQSITIGEPYGFVKNKKNVQCIVPKTVTILTSNMTDCNKSELIAISDDYGKNWLFIDGENKKPEQLRIDYPIISSKLEIPEPSFSNTLNQK